MSQFSRRGPVDLQRMRRRLAGTDYALEVLADSPTIYYRLGEASGAPEDETGLTTSTVNGTPTYGAAAPLVGDTDTAMRFTGAGSAYVTITDNAALATDILTVEAWVYFATTTNADFVVGRRNVDNVGGFTLERSGVDLNHYVRIGAAWQVVTVPAPTGKWVHVVYTYDGANIIAYHDGQEVGRTAIAGVVEKPASARVVIGASSYNLALSNDFTVDEIAVYPTVLTLERIRAHYNASRGAVVAAGTPPALPATVPAPEFRLHASTISAADGALMDTWIPYVDSIGVTPAWAYGGRPYFVASDAGLNNHPSVRFVKNQSDIVFQNYRANATWAGEYWIVSYSTIPSANSGPFQVHMGTNAASHHFITYPHFDQTFNWAINGSWVNKTAAQFSTGPRAAGASRDASTTYAYSRGTTAVLTSATQPTGISGLVVGHLASGVEIRVVEAIAFPTMLTAAERTDLYNYFVAQYGVA